MSKTISAAQMTGRQYELFHVDMADLLADGFMEGHVLECGDDFTAMTGFGCGREDAIAALGDHERFTRSMLLTEQRCFEENAKTSDEEFERNCSITTLLMFRAPWIRGIK